MASEGALFWPLMAVNLVLMVGVMGPWSRLRARLVGPLGVWGQRDSLAEHPEFRVMVRRQRWLFVTMCSTLLYVAVGPLA